MATAMSCLQFCEHYHLLQDNSVTADTKETLDEKVLNHEVAFAVFTKQLGEHFNSWHDLLHSKYGWLAKNIREAIPFEQQREAIDYALQGHLYQSTALLGLLSTARCFGVVTTHELLALKKQNRALWYALASVGRKVVFVEGAGIIAQFHHEIQMKQQLGQEHAPKSIPTFVEPAVVGLERALAEEHCDRQWCDTSLLSDHLNTLQ